MHYAEVPFGQIILLDIETVSRKPDYATLDPYWQKLWMEKIQHQLTDDAQVAVWYEKRAAVMAEFGKIICISTGRIQGNRLRIKSFSGDDEMQLLRQFADFLLGLKPANQLYYLAGHNIREFDVPYISRRMMIHGIRIPDLLDVQQQKPWELRLIDTFQLWRFGDFKNFTSLQLLAACLGIPSPKSDINGSDVGRVYWHEHDLERIVTYCERDVLTVYRILKQFRGESL